MAMSQEDLDEMQKLFKKARQTELPFGLCLGKKPEANVFFMDLKKSPEVMMRKAKAEGETGKVSCGTVAVKGKIATLKIEGKLLPGMAKNLKTFMTKNGVKMKVVIADPNGQVLEEDGEEDEDDDNDVTDARTDGPEPDGAQNTDAGNDDADNDDSETVEDPAARQWGQVAAALGPMAAKFENAPDPRAAQILKAWAGAETAAEKGDYKSAMAVAAKLKPILAAGPAATGNAPATDTQDNPDKKKWDTVEGPIAALYTKALANNPENRSQLEAAWGMAVEKADGGDFAAALTIVSKLKPRLDEAAKAAAPGQQAEVPKDVVPFQKSRVLWVNTRSKMQSEIGKLEKAIIDVCGNDPELAPIAREATELTARLSVFDSQLEDVLDEITNTPDGPERARLKTMAQSKIREFQAALQDPFFQDVDTENGFVNVAVTATATKSLQSIADVLAR